MRTARPALAQTNTDMGKTAGVEDKKVDSSACTFIQQRKQAVLACDHLLDFRFSRSGVNHCLPTRNPTPPEEDGGEVAWAYCSASTDAQQIYALSTI